MRQIRLAILFAVLSIQYSTPLKSQPQEMNKISIMERFIPLSNQQKSILSNATAKLKASQDSINKNVKDIDKAMQLQYDAKQAFHNVFISTLSTSQLIKYVKVTYTPEIKAKTGYYISLLNEIHKYDEISLTTLRKEIFEYLILEKIVYVKHKYDYGKQKENISRLKTIQPKTLKESLNLEKQKGMNKIRNGRITW